MLLSCIGLLLVNTFTHFYFAHYSGEEAFSTISDEYLWPHEALKESLFKLEPTVPITFLYGKHSQYYNDGGKQVKKRRRNIYLPAPLNAAHHLQAEAHKEFNKEVTKYCDMVDGNTDRK